MHVLHQWHAKQKLAQKQKITNNNKNQQKYQQKITKNINLFLQKKQQLTKITKHKQKLPKLTKIA